VAALNVLHKDWKIFPHTFPVFCGAKVPNFDPNFDITRVLSAAISICVSDAIKDQYHLEDY